VSSFTDGLRRGMSGLRTVEWKGATVQAYVSDEEPETIVVTTYGGKETYVQGRCPHNLVIPIETVIDPPEVIAHLCLRCDEQLPEGWKP
jgi:hypothetical protein